MKNRFIRKTSQLAAICFCMILSAKNSQAQENTLQLRETIKGNQEQPTVLYIVPWRAVDAPPASYKPLANLVKENYRLIDRDEFRRTLKAAQASPTPTGE
jgi:hypothetical protein